MSLIESIRTYDRSMERIEDKRGVLTLMAGMRKELQNLIAEVSKRVLSDIYCINSCKFC